MVTKDAENKTTVQIFRKDNKTLNRIKDDLEAEQKADALKVIIGEYADKHGIQRD